MDNPIRGRTRPLSVKAEAVKKFDANLNAKIHNRFDIEVVDAKTGKIKQRAQAENVICSALWTRLLTPNTYFNYIHYGTGSGTPASTDTSLFTFLGYGTPSTTDDVRNISMSSSVYSFRRKITLSESTAVGSTLTEVGIGYSTTSSSLCTHAMLKDMNGNQISIAKTATDIINIYATIFVHFGSYDNNALVFNEKIYTGDSTDPYIFRVNSFFEYLAGNTSRHCAPTVYNPAHSRNSTSDLPITITPTYSASSKTITLVGTRMGTSNGNIGGFDGLILSADNYSGKPGFPIAYIKAAGSWMNGTNIVGEAIGTGDGSTKKFKTAFGFASGATVYIDGVETTIATVSKTPLLYANMENYFEPIVIENGAAYPAIKNATNNAVKTDNELIFYNPYYSYGIKQFAISGAGVYVSNDLLSWTFLTQSSTSTTYTVPSEYQNFKYWKIVSYPISSYAYFYNLVANTLDGYDMEFATAPASGAVITSDYHTDVVGKNSNYVFDLTVTIQLGEYTT